MKQFYFCFYFLLFSISTIFSQDTLTKDNIPMDAKNSSIGYVELFTGGAFGYVDGFAAGGSINALYSNVLFTFGYTMDNEQGGLEYVENGIIPINYYKHYRIDNFPLMVGFYHPFRGASLSASAGLSLLLYSEYVDVNTFSVFNSNATEIYSDTNLGFPFEFNLKLFSKDKNALVGYGLKLFGNLGKYNYTGLGLVLSLGNYK
ncbi:hypothetical protein [Flavobacterium sp.]|uniref:hypothetical protein n=1 Tax=Flavobacterium sp. TaxID=239 RepID=UPI0025B9BBAF|nr:hypothetical protein [Flavobacterium sp.]MBA4275176.1 hypothetical protein [Flavobacterium sp.]